MQGNRLVTLLGLMAIAIAGCASEEPPVVTSPTPSPATPSTPSPAVTTPSQTQPMVAQRPGLPAPVPGLIQSTNPQERGRQVETEIRTNQGNNPFAPLPLAPIAGSLNTSGQPTGTAQPARGVSSPSVPNIQGSPLGVNLPPVVAPPRTSQVGSSSPGRGQTRSTPSRAPQTGSTPRAPQSNPLSPGVASNGGSVAARPTPAVPLTLPPRPSTDAANSVEVTGVILVGSVPHAIVFAPGDGTSRYVSSGQRISGGRVLVKRIDVGNGSDPVVILEENGVEVSRTVGEKPPQQTNNPAA